MHCSVSSVKTVENMEEKIETLTLFFYFRNKII